MEVSNVSVESVEVSNVFVECVEVSNLLVESVDIWQVKMWVQAEKGGGGSRLSFK